MVVMKEEIDGTLVPEFKLSFFDNNNYHVISNNSFLDSLAFKSPELLNRTATNPNFKIPNL